MCERAVVDVRGSELGGCAAVCAAGEGGFGGGLEVGKEVWVRGEFGEGFAGEGES